MADPTLDPTADDAPVAAPTPDDGGLKFSQVPMLLFIRGLAMVSVMVGLIAGLHYYIGTRLIAAGGWSPTVTSIAWVVLWAGFISMPISFSSRAMPKPFSTVLQWIGFGWMGVFGVTFAATAISDLIRVGLGFFVAPQASWHHTQALVALSVSAVALVWGFFVARGKPGIERVTVKVPGLARELDGFTIAQISDVHIGETLGYRFMQTVVDQVNSIQADVVAVTGDLVDGSVRKLRDQVAPLGKLEGKHGVYFVTGNHEYYSGADAWEAEVARLGLTVLHNSHQVVERNGAKVVVGGVPDVEGAHFNEHHRPDTEKTFRGAPPASEAPRILLAHQPRFARQAQKQGVSLMLSGHTHGGQIFPFMAFVRLQQPVIAGLKTLWGVPVYTSKGTGYWGPPFRVGPRSEVTAITLRPA